MYGKVQQNKISELSCAYCQLRGRIQRTQMRRPEENSTCIQSTKYAFQYSHGVHTKPFVRRNEEMKFEEFTGALRDIQNKGFN
ncbi:hypothetical protein CHS0354_026354 [Potamilus streckersoni]|uniref:Uncharacterized protein n=1 Tax=Potamilus streckersoni TaxID=2493646 RepID=A0AAE0W6E6_9BIVA|nr:hypothetical protein CHS0354_026354 [Potamilus streckersoni]